jgi:phosphoribosylanthranilate isomerase
MTRYDAPAAYDFPASVRFVVKICGITRREDALAAAEAGATAIGFIFYPKSPRFVAPETAAALGEELDKHGLHPWKVGVFVNEPAAMIAAVMSAGLLDIAQIYGGDPPPAARVWRAFRVESSLDRTHVDASFAGSEAVLLDGARNGNSFDWSIARDLATRHHAAKVIVAGGLNASNVADAISVVRPWGVDASSSLETSPGVKDREKVRRFVEASQRAALENIGSENAKEFS